MSKEFAVLYRCIEACHVLDIVHEVYRRGFVLYEDISICVTHFYIDKGKGILFTDQGDTRLAKLNKGQSPTFHITPNGEVGRINRK